MLLGMMATAQAEQPGTYVFWETWARTDLAVAENVDQRTWMWGPEAISETKWEAYVQSEDGYRLVQYFDKSRMEITDPNADPNDARYVTNGLLAKELITGQVQFGDDNHDVYVPADIPVAGDFDDPWSPTYATFGNLLYVPLGFPGEIITAVLDTDGVPWNDDSYEVYGVTTEYYVPETNHRIASIFWDFMNADGPIWRGGGYMLSPLFESPFYATGYPITEAYWAEVKVGGTYRDVLMQCFERRCLTFTPGNSEGFEVEAGNIGLHYYVWRYGELPSAYR